MALDRYSVVTYPIVRNPWNSLIPLSRGSFDVLVGMDRLSKRKFVIVCHEKVVRIPLKGDEILRVHGERTQGVVKTLLNTKSSSSGQDMATSSEASKGRERAQQTCCVTFDQIMKRGQNDGRNELKLDVVRDSACLMTIQYGVRGMILTAQSEAFKQENVLAEILHGLDQQMERKGDESLPHKGVKASANSDVMYSFTSAQDGDPLQDDVRLCLGDDLKKAQDHSQRQAIYHSKPLEFEVGDRVLLKVSPWKGVIRFGKKCKLAPRYVGPFEILERIGLVAYWLRLPEELSGVHDIFHVSNLKRCLADASLHVPLDEIKVDKTLRFVEEPVEIMDCEIKSLKCSKISLVKGRWNSKRGPEFTWEREDYMKSKYP
ncbi:hypothetical protein Tco_1112327 [Tanacetum coccineum]|uniref:Tf2-1-like SH3-like domain-containing protein n=1 Tax=Tanacetum coccineum TaxID=301880 RepID=A0ABQ5IPF4_9ASTR